MTRIGSACPDTGIARPRCPCPDCHHWRSELATWNQRLASEHLTTDRGTRQRSKMLQRRRQKHQNDPKP